MKRLFGNGRPIAAAILTVGVAAVAVPAFGDSGSNGGGSSGDGGASVRPGRPMQTFGLSAPRPALSGAMRKRADKAASCLRSKDIPGARKSGRGFFVGPSAAASKAFRKAATECGLPPPPPLGPGKMLPRLPHGKMLPPPGCTEAFRHAR